MTIIFSEKRRQQKYLAIVLVMILIGAALIFYFGIMKELKQSSSAIFVPPKNMQINFSVLKNPVLSELELFEEIMEFTGDIGRENPFMLKKTNKKQ